MSLTPRFTTEEKEILYSLFHQHEEIIDIKFRKKQRSKYSVRDTWDQIVHEFNGHPSVSQQRNVKQIQKFWLNARLRKQYPFRIKCSNVANSLNGNQSQLVTHVIKDEPEYLNNNDTAEQGTENETFEEIEMDASVTQLDEDSNDPHQEQQTHHHQQQQLQQHVQHQQTNTIQTQQISVDQISADKLTLNDLLQFKTARPRDEIILQIKQADATSSQITIPSPTRITIPTHQQQHAMATITASGYNQQIISEIKPQQITLAQYQAQQQQQLQQQQQQQMQQQQQHLQHQQIAVAHQQQQQQQPQQVKIQLQSPAAQFTNGTPTFTCTTFNAVPATAATATVAAPTTASIASAATTAVTVDSFEEKINYFKLKEAELRFKEEQVALERKKIDLSRAQEELKHLREVHHLQVEELKLKIRILQEEEKVMRKNINPVQS
ncbi:regulatory protein zeste [Teleopsis dalmanni]|uniref:regulatory protein zeste n=1 Tax=Teleopsis dalmanni TaxID=139649 RepID=UPI0018CF067E|nr:regulatory protein zeste [Teleopsis dalmanni]